MDHVITFKTSGGPVLFEVRHYADCSCSWGTPFEGNQESLYRIILVHLADAGMIEDLENMP
jgi:hypothetical protein